MPNRYGIKDGDHLTYYPSPEYVGDNTHFECVVSSLTESERYARIVYNAADGEHKRTVPLSRLKRQGLLLEAA